MNYISFCIVTLKTAILIAESIFKHFVNNCIFPEILKGKFGLVKKDFGLLFNGNTIVALIREISVVKCIEIWKRFLVQQDILVQQNPKAFQPVLKFFRSEF